MITHEEARNAMMKIESDDAYYGEFQEEHKLMATYIYQNEQRDKDVVRYFELRDLPVKELHEIDEFYDLEDKLSKVGKEEWKQHINA